MVGLWLAYLVPHRLRHRQQLLEARTEDRYSGAMRILAVADRADRDRDRPAARSVSSVPLLTPARGTRTVTGGGEMHRPHEQLERRAVDARRRIAQRQAERAAVLARRRAAARRRLVLVLALLVLAAGAWTAVGLGVLLPAVAAVPSVLLLAVLALGRAAVLSARRSDAAWAREQAALQHQVRLEARRRGPVATGRAVRANDDDTLVIEKVVEEEAAPQSPSAETWEPVPVPRPTYTLKAPAPRREPAPLELEEPAVAVETAAEEERTEPALDLDAILARRRAVGE
mgnify:CR=1 FL=1